MIREIKFRGMSEGKWYYGLLTFMFGRYAIVDPKDENTVHLVDEKTIGQYTGRKDKIGNEIIEGNIVSWQDKEDIYSIEFGEFGVPNFEEQGYQDWAIGYFLKPQHNLKEVEPFNMTIPLNKVYASEITVIGNIYDNPELLESDK